MRECMYVFSGTGLAERDVFGLAGEVSTNEILGTSIFPSFQGYFAVRSVSAGLKNPWAASSSTDTCT